MFAENSVIKIKTLIFKYVSFVNPAIVYSESNATNYNENLTFQIEILVMKNSKINQIFFLINSTSLSFVSIQNVQLYSSYICKIKSL